MLTTAIKKSFIYPFYLQLRKRGLFGYGVELLNSLFGRVPMLARWFNRIQASRWTKLDQQRCNFYAQFIKPGDVVFDVGANIGNRTKVFLKLGAQVVAFEPQRACADFLASAFGKRGNFILQPCALGRQPGSGSMRVSQAHVLSSLSPEWIQATQASGRFAHYRWDQEQPVSIETLDNMLAKYGMPAFIKIDVEGYELQVLSGLSQMVPALSFEYTPEMMANAFKCIDYLQTLAAVEFQVSFAESMVFATERWMSAAALQDFLHRHGTAEFGDIYARAVVIAP